MIYLFYIVFLEFLKLYSNFISGINLDGQLIQCFHFYPLEHALYCKVFIKLRLKYILTNNVVT